MMDKRFSEIFKENRKLSYRILAKKIGVNPVTLVQYARGKTYPSEPTLKRLCDEFRLDFESMKTLIENEKSTNRTRKALESVYPAYPKIRSELLKYFQPLNIPNYASKTEIEQELRKAALHRIEIVLLTAILRNLDEKGIAPFTENPIEYFRTLSEVGIRIKFEQARFEWSFNKERFTILFSIYKGKGESTSVSLHLNEPPYEGLTNQRKNILFSAYSKDVNFGQFIISPAIKVRAKIEDESTHLFLHPIEKKVLCEFYREYKKLDSFDPHDAEAFFIDLMIQKKASQFNEVIESWAYDLLRDILIISFKAPQDKSIVRIFAQWYELPQGKNT